jgi:hypothetical protein
LENVQAFFSNEHGAWVIMSEESFASLRPNIPDICEIYRHPMFSASLADLVAHRAPQDVLLVANRGCRRP